MKNSKLLITLFCFSLCLHANAQTWYFGNKTGIRFNANAMPTAISAGNNIYSLEGTAMSNDGNGNLLFYTDGKKAYYKDGTEIPFDPSVSIKDLGGNSGSTQCAVIIPVPSANNSNCGKKYYIFTVKEATQTITGFTVSQLEFTPGNPNGIVTKRIVLKSTTRLSEKISAVNDGAGGYWLMLHGFDDNATANSLTYFRLHITPSSAFPSDLDVKDQVVGSSHSGTQMNAAGQLKYSISGNFVAAALYQQNSIDLLSFNPSTGNLSLLRTIKNVANSNGGVIYGLEFSPNSRFLYATSIAGSYKGIFQIDLSSPNYSIANIQSGTGNSFEFGLLQLGPDNRIYSANMNEQNDYIGVIMDPNQPSSSCNYIRKGIKLLTGSSTLGLPTVIQNEASCGIITTDVAVTTVCGCSNTVNLIKNGNFEKGAVEFTSKFSLMTNNLVPGTYTVADYASYKNFCANWNVSNPSTCPRGGAMQGKFLIANGQTGQSGIKTVWGQAILVETGKEYKLCMNLKNLSQCCFDVKPKVSILYHDGTQQKNIGPVEINQANTPCDWYKLTANISIPAGATSTINMPISIALDQSDLGDGNDLAIDDISLIELKPLPASLIDFGESISPVDANGKYTITATAPGLPAGTAFYWEIQDITDPSNPIILSNPSQWWSNPLSTNFNGYNNGTIGNSSVPGIFVANRTYRIVRGTWGDCNSWSAVSHIYKKEINSNKIGVQKDNKYKAVPPQAVNALKN